LCDIIVSEQKYKEVRFMCKLPTALLASFLGITLVIGISANFAIVEASPNTEIIFLDDAPPPDEHHPHQDPPPPKRDSNGKIITAAIAGAVVGAVIASNS
jgi:hypothetical protein